MERYAPDYKILRPVTSAIPACMTMEIREGAAVLVRKKDHIPPEPEPPAAGNAGPARLPGINRIGPVSLRWPSI